MTQSLRVIVRDTNDEEFVAPRIKVTVANDGALLVESFFEDNSRQHFGLFPRGSWSGITGDGSCTLDTPPLVAY